MGEQAMGQWQRALIIGASSGMGQALAEELGRQGAQVALVARRTDALERIAQGIGPEQAHVYAHDVREFDAVPALFQQITHDLGGLDLVIYAAGILPHSAPDSYDTAQDIDVLATNLLGAVAWLNEAAARFARTRQGTIIGISSVAGDRGRRANPVYGASKAALSTYLESLRNRLTVRGVAVITIKPGYVATDMLAGTRTPRFLPVIPPDRAAREILAAAAAHRQVAYVPPVWGSIMRVVRAIPSGIFRRLNM
jgi:decaprenylphospho-beta-D-erythro-pentofuranosid-2-ulose 2-reductase